MFVYYRDRRTVVFVRVPVHIYSHVYVSVTIIIMVYNVNAF